jgi:hypothetical protein
MGRLARTVRVIGVVDDYDGTFERFEGYPGA